jgi:hypothetical protein
MRRRVAEAARFVAGQVQDTVEVIRLKLRIIGFSNKLTGLYARLGDVAYAAMDDPARLAADADAQRLAEDIADAMREIKEAEEGIRKRLRVAARRRQGFAAGSRSPEPERPDAPPAEEEGGKQDGA